MKKNRIAPFIFLIVFSCMFGMSQATAVEKTLSSDLSNEEIISKEDLRQLQEKNAEFVLFDARGKLLYNKGHIRGALLPLPLVYYQEKELMAAGVISKPFDFEASLAEAMKSYSPDTRIVTYCNSNCKLSVNLLRQLQKMGFKNVRSMEEGYQAWEKVGYPVILESSPVSNDSSQRA